MPERDRWESRSTSADRKSQSSSGGARTDAYPANCPDDDDASSKNAEARAWNGVCEGGRMRNVGFALFAVSMLVGCGRGCGREVCGEANDPCTPSDFGLGGHAPPLPSGPYRSSPTAPPPAAGSSGGGSSPGSADISAACVMPAGASSGSWSAFVAIDGEKCDIAAATGETQSGSSGTEWAVFICASCGSLGVVSVLARGDDGADYPQVCNDDTATAAVEAAICPASGAACGGYSFDATAPGSCTITAGPSQSDEGASISLDAMVTDGSAEHEIVVYATPP
jgi:hypothetical protein